MQAQVYEGYFEKGRFIPFGAASILERRKVQVILFDEIVSDEISRRRTELDNLIALAKEAADEVMPALERVNFPERTDI